MIKAKVITDSISAHTGQRITTFELEYPRFILAEVNTHRCIVGDTKLTFDLPTAKNKSKTRSHYLTVKEFYDKWTNGGASRLPSRLQQRDLSKINPSSVYSAKELATLAGFKVPTNIRTECRKGNLKVQNPNKTKSQDWLILGSDYLDFETRPKEYPQKLRHRLEQMHLRCLDETTNMLSHTNITDIWEVGVKKTYKLTAGKLSITTTDDHLILTDKGWKELKDIKVNADSIISLSIGKLDLLDPIRLKKINGKWVSKFNLEVLPKITEKQNNVCHTCREPKPLEIHHVIPVSENPDLAFDETNVIAVCNHCHKHVHHKKQGWQTGNPLIGKPVLVSSIEYVGEQTVYDLSVSSEQHNFIANGIVVHNCFSRNTASSRAIPIDTMIELVQTNTAEPIHWGSNKAGMQAGDEIANLTSAINAWTDARNDAIKHAKRLQSLGLHKQIVNRVLEPFQTVKTLVTATSFDNFFNLRLHEDAQPEIHELAKVMYEAIQNSIPFELSYGEWHLPYIERQRDEEGEIKYFIYNTDEDPASEAFGYQYTTPLSLEQAQKISCSCCAQVSYRKSDNSIEKAITIYDKLVNSSPVHASAFEHCATPIDIELRHNREFPKGITGISLDRNHPNNIATYLSGNFTNWIQYRQLIPNHDCKEFSLESL